MKISREQFLSLKVILAHTFVNEGYFFTWAETAGHLDKIRFFLSELREKLEELNKRYPGNFLFLSQEYQAAIENIEFAYEDFADFLLIHESVELFLSNHVDFLEGINAEFHAHFMTKLLPLRIMLSESAIHGSAFGQWVSQSHFYNFIKTISFELKSYFYKMDGKYAVRGLHYPFMVEFVDAIRYMDHNPVHFQTFIKNHPTVILIFINYMQILEETHRTFQSYLEEKKSASLVTQAFHMDYSKWIQKLNAFSSSDAPTDIFIKTAAELQQSAGDPQRALILFERLEVNLMLKQYANFHKASKSNDPLAWARKKITLLQPIITQLEKTEEERKQLDKVCSVQSHSA